MFCQVRVRPTNEPSLILSCPRQVAFFKTIRAEIAKATEFYLGMEQQMAARKRRIRYVLKLWVVRLVVHWVEVVKDSSEPYGGLPAHPFHLTSINTSI